MPVEIVSRATIYVGDVRETGITTVSINQGGAFWDNLQYDQKQAVESPLARLESWLKDQFPNPPAVPANLLAARHLDLAGILNQQTDPDTCTYIAVANAMRVLREQKEPEEPEYSLRGLRQRIELLYGTIHDQLTPESVDGILRSGEPFDKFQLLRIADPIATERPYPMDMFQLLKKLQEGAVAIIDWPYSPTHIRKNNVDSTHARTLTGFTRNRRGLFFHFVDPYINQLNQQVRVYSFRDLVVACLYQAIDLKIGITADSIDRVARSAWIIERVSPPIRTLVAAV